MKILSNLRGRTTVLAIVSVLAGTLTLGTMSALAASTLVVDKDKLQCPDAQFQSIQAAVGAALPGDTILVCPDLYIESVVVPKTLAIRGFRPAGGGGDARVACFDSTPSSPDPTQEPIVQGGTFAFHLLQNDIVVEGLLIQGAVHGIQTSALFSGYSIANNVIQLNSFGIHLESSDQNEIVIEHNCFRENFEGMRTEPGFLANVRIAHNSFSRNFLGMLVQDGALNVRIEHNESLSDLGFFLRGTLHNSTISHNVTTMSGAFGAAIELAGSNIEVSHNVLRQGRTGLLFILPNASHSVHRNDIRNMSEFGIVAFPNALDNTRISHNKLIENGFDGINLRAGNSGNHVEKNNVDGNGRDGIRAEGASGNVFEANHMKDNVEHDAHDDNRPSNIWVRSKCSTDFPPGTICE